jgi:5-methylcytosine-specific restriction endonuclease McrA
LHEWLSNLYWFSLDYADGKFEKRDYFELRVTEMADTGLIFNEGEPDFEILEKCEFCESCNECLLLERWENFFELHKDKIGKTIIHTAFHLLMSNKKFLLDFNEYLAELLENQSNKIPLEYQNQLIKGRIPRATYWPSWLETALFHRDKGVCSICRKNVTGEWNLTGKLGIDHIVPISNFGNNDPSNLQILCEECNLSKGNRSNATSGIDVPLWNLD